MIAGLGAVGGYEFYRWIDRSPGAELLPKPLRETFGFNAKVSRELFQERGLAPTYPLSKAVDLRTNGNFGLKQDLVMESYRMQVVGVDRPKSYKQYVDDVTTWDYKYKDAAMAFEGHDVKTKPGADGAKPEGGKQGGDKAAGGSAAPAPAGKPAGTAATDEQGRCRRRQADDEAGGEAGRGRAIRLGPDAKPEEGPGPNMLPIFQKAFARRRRNAGTSRSVGRRRLARAIRRSTRARRGCCCRWTT